MSSFIICTGEILKLHSTNICL